MSRPVPRQVVRAIAVAVVAAGLVAACGEGTSSTDPGTTQPARSSFADVGELAEALTAAGLPCTLEYEGLRDAGKELSLCTIEGEQATLSIWSDPSQLDAFLASTDDAGVGAAAVGANWTVDVSSPATAQRIADALGGTVKS